MYIECGTSEEVPRHTTWDCGCTLYVGLVRKSQDTLDRGLWVYIVCGTSRKSQDTLDLGLWVYIVCGTSEEVPGHTRPGTVGVHCMWN